VGFFRKLNKVINVCIILKNDRPKEPFYKQVYFTIGEIFDHFLNQRSYQEHISQSMIRSADQDSLNLTFWNFMDVRVPLPDPLRHLTQPFSPYVIYALFEIHFMKKMSICYNVPAFNTSLTLYRNNTAITLPGPKRSLSDLFYFNVSH
jgi:hypothetical protein